MSITDASTRLTTAWTEKPNVLFNARTLATITDCVSEVESRLKRGTLSTSSTPTSGQVQQWLIIAKQELASKKGFTYKRRYASVSTVANEYKYALPPDYSGGRTVLRDTSNDQLIPVWLEHWFDTKYPDPSEETANEPAIATIKNMELWLVPPPDAVYTLELEYERSGEDNTAADFSWLPEIERFRCCDFATWRGFMSLHMWDVAAMYQSLWRQGIGDAVREDGRKKWRTMNFQMIDAFTEHNMRKHQ